MKAYNSLGRGVGKHHQYDYLDLLSELRVHCVELQDVESVDGCDNLIKSLKGLPKEYHADILKKYIGSIIPKNNVVYQLASRRSRSLFTETSRNSKRHFPTELENR